MRVQVEIEYSAAPPAKELEAMRHAATRLASNPDSVSVGLSESDQHYPTILLEFQMKTQAQYKVVDRISDIVHMYTGKLYSDMTIRFPKG